MVQDRVNKKSSRFDRVWEVASHLPGSDPVDCVAAKVHWRTSLTELIHLTSYLKQLGVVLPWCDDILGHSLQSTLGYRRSVGKDGVEQAQP